MNRAFYAQFEQRNEQIYIFQGNILMDILEGVPKMCTESRHMEIQEIQNPTFTVYEKKVSVQSKATVQADIMKIKT